MSYFISSSARWKSALSRLGNLPISGFTMLVKALAMTLFLVSLAACSQTPDASPAPKVGTGGSSGEISPEIREACKTLFTRTIENATVRLVIVVDKTASVTQADMPQELATSLSRVSQADGSLTVIAVDGEGVAPRILAKNVALSEPGPRDRPSVREISQAVPLCVQHTLFADAKPTAPGTDLYSAVALASEIIDADTELWVFSDLISTTGAFVLDEQVLALDSETAVQQIVRSAPVDLRGVTTRFEGVGNTSSSLRTVDREWLRDMGRGLCAAWNGSGCEEIENDPIEPVAPSDSLPNDPLPEFPNIQAERVVEGCKLSIPASLGFEPDLWELRHDAADLLDVPIRLALGTDSEVLITGHTASKRAATSEELVSLSQKRADAVATLFIANGVEPQRVRAVGLGDARPLAEDLDLVTGLQIPEIAAAERRVEIIVNDVDC